MTNISCELHILVVFHGFPMVAESPFDILEVQPNPAIPTPANGNFSVTSRGYFYAMCIAGKKNNRFFILSVDLSIDSP